MITTPATEEVRAVGLAWLGVDPWMDAILGDAWQGEDRWGVYDELIPLHLPAGRDLACRVLAARWVDGERSGAEVALLICYALDGEKEAILALPEPWRSIVAHVPLDSAEVRIALALRGCLENDSHLVVRSH